MITKIYRKLLKEQKERGIIFSSSLSINKQEGKTIHEVSSNDPDKWEKIYRLKDDRFFRDSPFNYNIIRT